MEKIRRITAWLTIAVIVGLIIGTIICAVTGSKYFFGMLFLMIAVPAVLWVFMWFTRLVSGVDDIPESEDGLNDVPENEKGLNDVPEIEDRG